MKRVIFINDEPGAQSLQLATALREAGFDFKATGTASVAGREMDAEPFIARFDGEMSDKTRTETARKKGDGKSPPVAAVLCAVQRDADINELRTIVKRAGARWPKASLVAYRSSPALPTDEVLRGRIQNSRPNDSTLRRLGFTAIAGSPGQLPAVLRGLAAEGETKDFPKRNVETHSAVTSLPITLSAKHLRAAFELAAALHFAADQESAASTALTKFVKLIRADVWTIYLTTESGAKTTSVALETLSTIHCGANDNGGVARASSQAAKQAAFGETARTIEDGRRIVAVPLTCDDRTIGVLEATRTDAVRSFTGTEVDLLTALAAPLAAALSNVARIAEAERLSQTDDLTKLHNARFLRQCLISEIKRARRYRSAVSALFFDLDDFKQVNDRHGHLVGSHVLVELAAVILRSVRDTDIIARYGGDEFVVILPETPAGAAERVAERMRSGIASHTFTGGRSSLRLRLTASFGVAAFPEHAQSPQQLVLAADTAMYLAKAAHKNCVRLAQAVAD